MPRRTLLLPLVAALVLACARPKPVDPVDAVLPHPPELEKAQPYQPPFVVRFEKGDERLTFVAAEHGCDPGTFHLIDEALATGHVRLLIVEGFAAGKGLNPPNFGRHFAEWQAHGFCSGGGEPGYAVFKATAAGVSFMGGEPDRQVLIDAVLAHGFTKEDLLGFYLVGQIPQLRREGAHTDADLEKGLRSSLTWMVKDAGLEDAKQDYSFAWFVDWYGRRQGQPFSLSTVDDEEAGPLASGKFLTQHISSIVSLTRDRAVVRLIADKLASDKDVLVVFGGSHFARQRPALEMMMGKPVEEKPGPR